MRGNEEADRPCGNLPSQWERFNHAPWGHFPQKNQARSRLEIRTIPPDVRHPIKVFGREHLISLYRCRHYRIQVGGVIFTPGRAVFAMFCQCSANRARTSAAGTRR